MLGRTDRRLRHVALLVVMALMATALGVRLSYWQLGEAPMLQQLAAQQVERPDVEAAERGEVTDRRGRLLATNAYRDLLAAYPDLIAKDEREPAARELAALLGFDGDETEDLVAEFEEHPPYVIVSRRLTQAQSEQIRAGIESEELSAISLEPSPLRFYPNQGGSPGTTLASQVLGFVSEDGQGQYGIEQHHQALLAGRPGFTAAVDGGELPVAGSDLGLSIDASLQLRVEKELHAAWVANRASRVSAVVLDPHNGDVLAWASVPGYDANAYATTARSQPGLFQDPLASQVYEPGSVMKMLTAAAALEQGVVEPDTLVHDTKALTFGSILIHNSDRRAMGRIPFEDVIAYSRNVATGKVAAMLGDTTSESAAVLYDMWSRLGVGSRTGIELSNEAAGIVSSPDDEPWQPIELANRAFGQGVAVTPLQLAVAYGAMVNGGVSVSPRLVNAIDGTPLSPDEHEQVIDPAVAAQLQDLMVHVVTEVDRYAEDTLIPGYLVGGKTGTAQIWDSDRGRWRSSVYNHTFCGFVGGDEPEAVIVVRIHEAEPRVQYDWGIGLEMSSNELFRRIAHDVIGALDIAPSGSATIESPAD
jgi:cell division protein FtsI (penicillin-binding protein 3)